MQSSPSIFREQISGQAASSLAQADAAAHSHDNAHGASHNASHGAHSGPHVVSPLILLGVFAVLMVLTILTVAVTKIDLGYNANLALALAIAVVKAVLVVMYFMHLRYDSIFYTAIVVACLVFIGVFIGMTIIDTAQYAPVLAPRIIAPS
jgi:cytochrome c oxidase subunit IV